MPGWTSAADASFASTANQRHVRTLLVATDDELRLLVARGTSFDPEVCLVQRIYLEHRELFRLTDARVTEINQLFPLVAATFKRALATPGLKLIFGTDAIPLQHGRNAEELICRVLTPWWTSTS